MITVTDAEPNAEPDPDTVPDLDAGLYDGCGSATLLCTIDKWSVASLIPLTSIETNIDHWSAVSMTPLTTKKSIS
jgi:hypothetical protein